MKIEKQFTESPLYYLLSSMVNLDKNSFFLRLVTYSHSTQYSLISRLEAIWVDNFFELLNLLISQLSRYKTMLGSLFYGTYFV